MSGSTGAVRAVIAGVFGLLYAYAVWNALAFLVSQAQASPGLNGYGWFVLLLAVVFPIIAYAIAFTLGRGREWWEGALVLLAGLGLVAVFWLNILAYSAISGSAMLN